MSAKEMFEDLGYELVKHETYMFYYKDEIYQKDEDDPEDNGYITISIEFNFQEKAIIKTADNDYGDYINLSELQAINKQIEELGWDNV